jgi:glutaredoxin 3
MKFTIYTGPNCTWCTRAKNFMNQKLIPYEEKTVAELKERMPEARSIPQLFVGDEHIGGYQELVDYFSGTETSNS